MTFFTILFIILLGGLLLMRLIPWLLAMKIRQMQRQGQNLQNQQTQQKSNIKRTRKKRIDKNTGDYIDYEEIKD